MLNAPMGAMEIRPHPPTFHRPFGAFFKSGGFPRVSHRSTRGNNRLPLWGIARFELRQELQQQFPIPYDSFVQPRNIDLDREKGLTIEWDDGVTSFYPVALLRRLSPSAEQRELRKEMKRNPLTVLPSGGSPTGPLTATNAELVGNYAVRITFSDGHHTGIFSWAYLREIDPGRSDSD